ncbi:MAG: HlyD family efflux transporter periplasmic adaptor subunit [Bacteroidales bacterium]
MNRQIIIFLFLILCSCKGNNTSVVQVTAVRKGTFTEEVIEQGTLSAVNSLSVAAPSVSYRYGSLKITKIVDEGTEVEKGDTVVIFDPSEIKRGIVQAEQQLEIARAEYEKLKSMQQSELDDLEADLELAMISQEIANINYETSVYEPEATKKEIQLRLETATIAFNRAKEQIESKKVIHREDLLQKSLSIRQLEKSLNEAVTSMNKLFVISPARGIIIKRNNWTSGQKWAVGDQPFSGSDIIDLPDLAEMRALVKINEVDVARIFQGQRVEIRPDAYSDSVYQGRVESVAYLAQNKDVRSKIKVFPTQIRINGQSGQLLPGLTVSCRIIVNELQDVMFVPIESLFRDETSEYVWLKAGSGFRRADVKTGAVNTNYVVVTEGLSENDLIALTDPYANREEANENKKGK